MRWTTGLGGGGAHGHKNHIGLVIQDPKVLFVPNVSFLWRKKWWKWGEYGLNANPRVSLKEVGIYVANVLNCTFQWPLPLHKETFVANDLSYAVPFVDLAPKNKKMGVRKLCIDWSRFSHHDFPKSKLWKQYTHEGRYNVCQVETRKTTTHPNCLNNQSGLWASKNLKSHMNLVQK